MLSAVRPSVSGVRSATASRYMNSFHLHSTLSVSCDRCRQDEQNESDFSMEEAERGLGSTSVWVSTNSITGGKEYLLHCELQ